MFDLENLDKTEYYTVPENYFEELPGRVMLDVLHDSPRKLLKIVFGNRIILGLI